MMMNAQDIARALLKRLWFPTALGWAAYGAMLLIFVASLPSPVSNSTANALGIYLGPVLIWGGGIAHAISVVRSVRALRHGAPGRGKTLFIAVFSCCGTLLALFALVLACCLK